MCRFTTDMLQKQKTGVTPSTIKIVRITSLFIDYNGSTMIAPPASLQPRFRRPHHHPNQHTTPQEITLI
jgi:hypothetical protein